MTNESAMYAALQSGDVRRVSELMNAECYKPFVMEKDVYEATADGGAEYVGFEHPLGRFATLDEARAEAVKLNFCVVIYEMHQGPHGEHGTSVEHGRWGRLLGY